MDYAEQHGFDPFVLANWGGVQLERFLSVKVFKQNQEKEGREERERRRGM